jgi:hypothetical protein
LEYPGSRFAFFNVARNSPASVVITAAGDDFVKASATWGEGPSPGLCIWMFQPSEDLGLEQPQITVSRTTEITGKRFIMFYVRSAA